MECPFSGSIVALPTPFRDGELDLEAFVELVEWHVESGSDGLVVAGTTGEAATLDAQERDALFAAAVEASAGRLPILAGVGTNDTKSSVELARAASSRGVDGLLVVTPYYNKPSRKGLVLHYQAVAGATHLPVMLYNVPSRTSLDLDPRVAREIGASCPNVVALKEANAAPERIKSVAQASALAVFAGEDRAIADFMQHGARGAISVVGNVVPVEVAELVRCARPGGDGARAAELVEFLAPLVRDLFIEVNPVPVKAALARLSRCSEEVRLPLATLEDGSRARLEATLRASGVLAPS